MTETGEPVGAPTPAKAGASAAVATPIGADVPSVMATPAVAGGTPVMNAPSAEAEPARRWGPAVALLWEQSPRALAQQAPPMAPQRRSRPSLGSHGTSTLPGGEVQGGGSHRVWVAPHGFRLGVGAAWRGGPPRGRGVGHAPRETRGPSAVSRFGASRHRCGDRGDRGQRGAISGVPSTATINTTASTVATISPTVACTTPSIVVAPPIDASDIGVGLPRSTDAVSGHTGALGDAGVGGSGGKLRARGTLLSPPYTSGGPWEVAVARQEIEVAEGRTELATTARVEGFIRKWELVDIERRRGELNETLEDTINERHTIDLRILLAAATEEGVRTTAGAFTCELDDRAQELSWRDHVLRDAEATAANADVELQREELERDVATRKQAVGDVEARARELEQRERALPPQPAPHFGEAAPDLEQARQRIADLERVLNLGTRIMAASIARRCAGRGDQGGARGGRRGGEGLVVRPGPLGCDLDPGELPGPGPRLQPVTPTEDFPEGIEEGARCRVADAVESIMVGFDGTPAAFQLAYREDPPTKDGTEDAPNDPPAA
uniref:Uncharacterized protein n=1 Tax=Leersia perrieri TaxID=77586 RepID=A0A0D9XW02_9ORYZ